MSLAYQHSNSSLDYLREFVYQTLEENDLTQWTTLFEEARLNWDLYHAGQLLREAKRIPRPPLEQALIRRSEGILAAQLGEFARAESCLQASLELLTKIRENGEETFFTLGEIGMLFRAQGKLKMAQEYHGRQLALAESMEDREYRVESLEQLGFDAYEMGNFREANQLLNEALTLSQNVENLARIHNALGLVAWQLGNNSIAENYFHKALDQFKHLGQEYPAAQALANLGNMAYVQNDFENARIHYLSVLQIFDRLGVVFDRIGILNNLGGISVEKENYEDAVLYYYESLELAHDLGDRAGEQNALINLGVVFLRQHQPDEAFSYYQGALSVNVVIGDKHSYRKIRYKMARTTFIWAINDMRDVILNYQPRTQAVRDCIVHFWMALTNYFQGITRV